MVDFSVGFDTQKQDDVCKEILQNIPETVLELVQQNKTGIEQAASVTVVNNNWYPSQIREGEESKITEDILRDLWTQAPRNAPNYNKDTSEIYMMHTHPSGLGGMSFADVATAIVSATNEAPVTGSFVITSHRGTLKINGLTLKTPYKGALMSALTIQAKKLSNDVREGNKSPNEAKATILPELQKVMETCSHASKVQDLKQRLS